MKTIYRKETSAGLVECKQYEDGDMVWFLNESLHREDGPAIDWADQKFWYLNGEYIPCKTNKEFLKLMKLKAFW